MDRVKKIYITELILHITELVTSINLAGEHEVFMDHYGHTKEIDVRICLNGWKIGKDWDFKMSAYYDAADYENQLVGIIELLKEIEK